MNTIPGGIMRKHPLCNIALVTTLFLAAAMPVAAQQKPTLKPADYGRFENLGSATLSPDGQWLAGGITRTNEENELRIHRVASDSVVVVKYGTQAAFSEDSRWVAYIVGYAEKERTAAQKANRPLQSKLGLLDLMTGKVELVNDIAGFSFSGDGRWLAMRGFAGKDQKHRGVDLIVRELTTGTNTTFGDVAESQWQEDGHLLAMAVDAETKAGNSVKLYDPATGQLRTLDSDTAGYRSLVWRRKADDLAVLRIRNDTTREGSTHVVLAWTGLTGKKPAAHVFDPATAPGFRADTRIVEFRPLAWTPYAQTVLFGTQPWPVKEKKDSTSARAADEDKPGVEVWHSKDVDILPEQKVLAQRDRERNYLTAWQPLGNKSVEVGNDLTENANMARRGAIAVATDGTPYDRERMFDQVYSDLYVVDVNTGERTRVKEHLQYNMGASPTGRYVLYLEKDNYWVYDVAKKTHTNITRNIQTSFVNRDDDHIVDQKPPYGPAGWTPNDATVLLYDKFDIWEVAPDGSKATRITDGAEDEVRYRLVFLDLDEDFRDIARPVYAALYGDKTKKSGYGVVQRGKKPVRMVFEDKNVSRLAKAKKADVYAYSKMAFDDSPDMFVGGAALTDARQVTKTNPFQADYAWGRAELINYTSANGKTLQASLHYPANYEPGKQYPMIVYIYEIVSNQIHFYSPPSERNPYNPTVWTQEGYFVLQPDIVYRDRNPGLSAVDCLVPAVQKAVSTGMVDGKRVGLVGHSWGGYQTAFAGTVTNTFAATVAGAPLTELASMYLSVYWNSGGTDARIFEISQGRMEVPPWQDPASYMNNSAVWNIEKMTSPMLMTFGDKDGAVDWHQGIEMYNAARRADKNLVMLVYEGENHGLAKKANQIDYQRRIMQWFNHYLKGAPAPDWITKGVKFLDKDKELLRAITTSPISSGSN
jgi:dipeptidyl aminopeptidase/acylaminoacyl peptidase